MDARLKPILTAILYLQGLVPMNGSSTVEGCTKHRWLRNDGIRHWTGKNWPRLFEIRLLNTAGGVGVRVSTSTLWLSNFCEWHSRRPIRQARRVSIVLIH